MIELNIPAMTCGGCVRGIARICASVDPEAKVQAELSSQRVTVESRVARERFVAALSEGGYAPAP